MAEFIYTMKKVRKAHGDKVILDDVTMAFYPGAKIGVVGPNGARSEERRVGKECRSRWSPYH